MDRQDILSALVDRYPTQDVEALSQAQLIDLLSNLSLDNMAAGTSLLAAVQAADPGCTLQKPDFAILAYLDDSARLLFNITGFEAEMEQLLRQSLPGLAIQLLKDPELALSRDPDSLVGVLDLIYDAAIGWRSDLGRVGENLANKIGASISALHQHNPDLNSVSADLHAFLEKDLNRVTKLEDRLAASEAGALRAQQGKLQATRLLNQNMADKQLPGELTNFLQGPWFASLQLIVIREGLDSDNWEKAESLTKTIIWTVQPMAEDDPQLHQKKQRLYQAIENLPLLVQELMVSLEHENEAAEAILATLEDLHVSIISGIAIEPEPFELLPEPESNRHRHATVSTLLLRQIRGLKVGQWFSYDQDGDHIYDFRIKLSLKIDDIREMLFTTRSGMKALEASFDEVAYYLSTGALKRLTSEAGFRSTLSTYLTGLITEHKKRTQAAQLAADALREQQAQDAASKKALAEAEALARSQQDSAARDKEAQTRANLMEQAKQSIELAGEAKITELTSIVASLKVGAWLELPGPGGIMQECKLAVRISAADKMIFVTNSGMKVGDYNSLELVQLLASGQGKITSEGIEFEDTLAQVVSGLRQNRERSFDDLAGTDESSTEDKTNG